MSENIANINFTITAGDTFKSEWFYLEDSEGDIVDLSTFVVEWGAKNTYDSDYIVNTMPLNCVKNATSVDIDNVVFTPNTAFYLTLTNIQTQELANACAGRTILYDVQVEDDVEAITTIIRGTITINRQVTV